MNRLGNGLVSLCVALTIVGCGERPPIATPIIPKDVPAGLTAALAKPRCDRFQDAIAGATVPEIEQSRLCWMNTAREARIAFYGLRKAVLSRQSEYRKLAQKVSAQ